MTSRVFVSPACWQPGIPINPSAKVLRAAVFLRGPARSLPVVFLPGWRILGHGFLWWGEKEEEGRAGGREALKTRSCLMLWILSNAEQQPEMTAIKTTNHYSAFCADMKLAADAGQSLKVAKPKPCKEAQLQLKCWQFEKS